MKSPTSSPRGRIRRRVSTIFSRRLHLAASLLLLVLIAGATSACTSRQSGTTSENGDPTVNDGSKAALCRFVTDINSASESAINEDGESANTSLSVLKSFEPRFDKALSDAPSVVKPAVQTVVDASRKIIRTNNRNALTARELDDVGEATYTLDTYCGIKRE